MGVNGLWTVIQPCARPTNLATLNRKRLAVDASIWIYQFLKAVRDKEGNALRNSHVVGFFRRICKLLWFGIRPVFVFDGGAPALKRQTITSRKRRREGRRDDAVRTAGKLLAVQMQRIVEEEGEKRKRRRELEDQGAAVVQEEVEEIPDVDKLVYVDELGMDQQERQKSRKFYKQDAYHLPELGTTIEGMGRPDDPRIMSIQELEEYARQFQSGEDVNLYDFSKIDFDGDFFQSLPPADRYNILNAARVRSRLRMGLSKEQLDDMFPDRMAFSRFQIERVQERNRLTQRLMKEAGMTGLDLTVNGGVSRIAGEKDREYILVKNDGVEGGWALGVVSKEKDVGEVHKPIDVDALDFQYQTKEAEEEWEDENDFEDVPIEGLNRLPKLSHAARDAAERRQHFDEATTTNAALGTSAMVDEEDSLFVQDHTENIDDLFESEPQDKIIEDEDEDLNRAIAMSLKNQHGARSPGSENEEEEDFEDVPAPQWSQKAVGPARPVTSGTGSMIAHIVNNRANAAVPKRRRSNASSDDELDLRSALSAAKKQKTSAHARPKPVPTVPNVKNPFGGPLPFEKLDWKSSIFGKRPAQEVSKPDGQRKTEVQKVKEDDLPGGFERDASEDLAGGFMREEADEDPEAPRPLPPWMIQDKADIRDSMRTQREQEKVINDEDREAAVEEEKRFRKDAVIEIESSDEEDDAEVVEVLPPKASTPPARLSPATLTRISPPLPDPEMIGDNEVPANVFDGIQRQDGEHKPGPDEEPEARSDVQISSKAKSSSPEPDFEVTDTPQPSDEDLELDEDASPEPTLEEVVATVPKDSPEPAFEDVPEAEEEALEEPGVSMAVDDDGNFVINDEAEAVDDYSDPEDEELLAQMAEEAEEHARFASQLNNKSEKENQEAYERELKALRTRQKKDRRDADEVTQIMVTECQALLRLFGLPYVTAPMEAEAQCAQLVQLGLVDGIVTDDSDTFLFGGTRVYKNMFNSNKFVECYLGNDLEKELSLSREQLISLAQLLGSDYTEGLPGVGPVTAMEILSEFPGKEGLEAFRDWWQDVQINNRPKEADATSVFRKKFRKSQGTKLFLPLGFPNSAVFEAYIKPDVDRNPESFQWGVPDVDGLRRFLMATIGWSQERTDEVLVPVIRDMNRRDAEGTQSNITRYFEGSVGVGAKEAFAPRQRTQTSRRMVNAVNKLRANAVVDSLSEEAPVEAADVPASGRRRKARENAVADDGEDDQAEELDGGQEPARQKRKGRKGKGSAT